MDSEPVRLFDSSSYSLSTGTPLPLILSSVFDIDVMGTFNMSRAAFPSLKANPNGTLIINITATLDRSHVHYQIHASAAKVCLPPFSASLLPSLLY